MRQKHWDRLGYFVCLMIFALLFGLFRDASAQYNSSNYQVDEVYFGAGGSNNISSTNYQGRSSIGDTVVGNSASTNFQLYGGFTTASEPVLEMSVASVNLDLGTLTTGATSTFTADFTVRAYLSSGYSIYTIGAPPTNESGRQIAPLTSGGSSSAGSSQFGMNLVANSSPSLGADPVQIPSSSFSYGAAATGYNTANIFRYNNGEKIAGSTKSSGSTQFTISYIVNVSPVDYAGVYKLSQSLVAVPGY